MPTIVFTGPAVTTARTGLCPTCGEKTRRSRTFQHTVNPFNRRPDGSPKTWTEVRADVEAEAAAWTPDPAVFEHDRCQAARLAPDVAAEDAATTTTGGLTDAR